MSTMLNVQSGIRLDRLRLLADYLESEVTDDHFDMRRWGNGCDPTAKDFCGCAGGHATALFREDGLYLFKDMGKSYWIFFENPHGPPPTDTLCSIKSFFGIDTFTAHVLFFFACDSHTRLEEVRLIREFIAQQETKS